MSINSLSNCDKFEFSNLKFKKTDISGNRFKITIIFKLLNIFSRKIIMIISAYKQIIFLFTNYPQGIEK